MAKNFLSEDDIEQALLQKLQHLHGFDVLDCNTAKSDDLNDGSNRNDKRDVVLADRLHQACVRLNPMVPAASIEQVVAIVMDRRSAMSAIATNRELDGLIRDGVAVEFDDADGIKQHETVRLIDFDHPANNTYLVVSQLWVQASVQAPKAGYRRPDIILYVNGLPLIFIELKNSTVKLRSAYDDNLSNYKHDIPQLFHCNAFCLLSNAIETKVGSFTAGWEHFFNWLRVDSEKEPVNRTRITAERTSLEKAVAGLCQPAKLLDYVENFILFHKETSKIIAQNHQFFGVNNAYERFLNRHQHDGKLGVFWHTQGSGKSFSMIFYARKIFRKVTGNFSFVVVTDRQDLDGQIYRNFLNTGTIQKKDAAQPANSDEMRKFLGQNKKVVFTLIQKFRYDKGKQYPRLFDPAKGQREVIVMVDEAHRTQYKSLAENMRAGLKGAHFLAFTGTPLLGKERNIDLAAIANSKDTFKNIAQFEQFTDVLLSLDEWRKSFYVYDNTVSSLYEACKPEIFKQAPRPLIAVIEYLRGVIDMHVEQADIDEISQKIAELLDESVVVDNAAQFAIKEHQADYKILQSGKTWDLSKIDFEKLKEDFADAQYKHIEIAEMRAFIEGKLRQMLEQNHTRVDFAQKLQEIVDQYNAGGSSTENYFEDLIEVY